MLWCFTFLHTHSQSQSLFILVSICCMLDRVVCGQRGWRWSCCDSETQRVPGGACVKIRCWRLPRVCRYTIALFENCRWVGIGGCSVSAGNDVSVSRWCPRCGVVCCKGRFELKIVARCVVVKVSGDVGYVMICRCLPRSGRL